MPTKRKQTMATSRAGVNHIRSIVEAHNCIFQEITLDNDLGNDAYIEFTLEEDATGCCIAVQIKSGPSFLSSDGSHFTFKTDRAHLEYWRDHLLPVGAILVNLVTNTAAWLDITEHLAKNPSAVDEGPYSLRVPVDRGFNAETFPEFARHFLEYRERYRQGTNFGLALEQFANQADIEQCVDGLKALFSFHRQRSASWYYVISCFRNFRGHPILGTLIHILCRIPGHMDLSWGHDNVIDPSVRQAAQEFLEEQFGREEILILLEAVDEYGFARGEIGQSAHAIIDIVRYRDCLLEQLAFDDGVEDEARFSALCLLIYYTQGHNGKSQRLCLKYVETYMNRFPKCHHNVLVEMHAVIREFGSLDFY